MKRYLVLEDGTIFTGEAFGASKEVTGEVVFNTGMTGYQEILSDPSYCGQIVTFTYPLIGNYGINRDDFESIHPAVEALIVKEVADQPSNWRNEMKLADYMEMKGIPGMAGVDTRKLTKIIRSYGTLKGAICNEGVDLDQALASLRETRLQTEQVRKVSTKSAYASPGRGHRIVIVDFGMKHGILRELNDRGCDCIVVPYHTSAQEILALSPDGIMLTNGPGDPKNVPGAAEMIRSVLGKVPLFGICLGHQLFALACGADTEKMKFGHRGSNHPVKELKTGKVSLTSQNHGYTVAADTIEGTDLEVTHIALNDGTIEGLSHKKHAAFTVQFHPEAAPGPEDANELFDEFLRIVELEKQGVSAYAKA